VKLATSIPKGLRELLSPKYLLRWLLHMAYITYTVRHIP
jgi:hypothetical protein